MRGYRILAFRCIRLYCNHTYKKLQYSRASKNFAFRESILIFFEAASPTNREKIFLKVLRTHPILPRIWFLQPRFVSQAQDLYARLKVVDVITIHKRGH